MSTETHAPQTPIEILHAALKKENDAYHFYGDLLNTTKVLFLQELLEKLRDEEHKHIIMIQKEIAKITSDT
jgi:rubrerythrin